jgi:hypothetical protein
MMQKKIVYHFQTEGRMLIIYNCPLPPDEAYKEWSLSRQRTDAKKLLELEKYPERHSTFEGAVSDLQERHPDWEIVLGHAFELAQPNYKIAGHATEVKSRWENAKRLLGL